MDKDLRNKMIEKARENGAKFGKKAELDFGAGAEWMYEQLQQDIKFLAERQLKAGSVSLMGERETGVSSNSIVSIAYGLTTLEKQEFPSDVSDMQSCEKMWKKLPEHRKTGNALKAMEAARNCDYYGKR